MLENTEVTENTSLISDARTVIPSRGTVSSGEYAFMPYDPKAPVSEKDLRTAKVMYKVAKTGENAGVKKGNNVCLLVPHFSSSEVTEVINNLMPHIKALIEAEQDKIIKGLHVSGGDDYLVNPDLLSMSAVIKSLEESKTSGTRMNKEVITSWFTDNLAESLSILFADKLGVSETPTEAEAEKVSMFMNVYKNKFAGLASNLVTYSVEETDKLLVALDKVSELDDSFEASTKSDNLITCKIIEKLEKMKKPVDVSSLFDL